MDAKEINNILSRINILHFFEYTGNKPEKKEGKWRAKCPFHAEGTDDSLILYPEEKTAECSWCGEGKKWNMPEYIRRLYNYQNGEAYEYIIKYWNESKPKLKYEICERSKYKVVIRIDDRFYTLTDVKYKKLHDFSMTVMAEYKQVPPFFADVNLTNTKRREDFILQAKEHFSLPEEMLEKDVQILQQAVANLQRENLQQLEAEKEEGRKKFKPTEQELDEAYSLLKQKDIVYEELLPDMNKIGFVGEECPKIGLFLACVSRVLTNPVCGLIISGSGGGKSHAIETIVSCFPDDVVHDLTGMSAQALPNYRANDLKNHIVVTDEIKGILDENMMYYIRSLMSKGKITRALSIQDKTTGRFHTVETHLNGPIAYFTSTTNEDDVNEETMNRMTVFHVDESVEQNLRIMKSMIKKRTEKGIIIGDKQDKIFRKYKAIAKCIKSIYPVFPDEWVEKLTFNAEKLYHKREFDAYLTLIEALALTRQYHRKHFTLKTTEGKLLECFYITAKDVKDINRLMRKMHEEKHEELKGSNAKCLEVIKQFCREEVKETKMKYYEKVFTMMDIHKYSSMPMSTVKKAFYRLKDDEYIVRTYGRHKTRHYYKLNIESDDEEFGGRRLYLWDPQ